MSPVVARSAWRLALRRRRLFAWNVLVPLLLLVPVVTSAAAPAHRAIVVTVFVAFFGAYGACIPLIRDGMSGWAEKTLLTGYGGRRWLLERLGASTAIDWLQLLPANLALGWLIDAGPRGVATICAATLVALLFANLLGALVATGVRALGEAALGCAVLSLFALHAAGVFRTPRPDSTWAVIEAWNPFRPLHHAWLEALGAAAVEARFGPALLSLAALLGVLAALGDRLARRIANTVSG